MDRFLTESKQGFIRWFFLENIVLFRLFFNFVYFYLEIVEEDDEEWIMVDFFTESKQGFIRWVRERISRVASTSHYLSYSDCRAVFCIFSDFCFLNLFLISVFLNLSDFCYLLHSDFWAVLCIFSDLWFPQSLTFKLSSCFLNLSDFRYQTAELFSVSILLPFTIFKGINVSTLVCKKGYKALISAIFKHSDCQAVFSIKFYFLGLSLFNFKKTNVWQHWWAKKGEWIGLWFQLSSSIQTVKLVSNIYIARCMFFLFRPITIQRDHWSA